MNIVYIVDSITMLTLVYSPRGTGAGLLVEPRSANAGALLGPQYVENQLQSRDLQDLLNRIDERESPPFMQRGAPDRTKREARFKTAINMLQRRSPPSPKLPASGNLSPEHGQQLPQIPQTPNRTPASTGGAPVSGNSPPQGQSPIRAAGANPPNQGQSSGGGSTRTSIDVHMGETKSSEDGSPVRISMLTGCTAIFFYGRDDHGKAVLVGSHVRLRHDGVTWKRRLERLGVLDISIVLHVSKGLKSTRAISFTKV